MLFRSQHQLRLDRPYRDCRVLCSGSHTNIDLRRLDRLGSVHSFAHQDDRFNGHPGHIAGLSADAILLFEAWHEQGHDRLSGHSSGYITACTPQKWPLWAGTGGFAAAAIAHKINAVFASDLLALLLVLALTGVIPRSRARFAAATALVSAGAAIVTSMLDSGCGLGDAVCQVILSYGGWVEFCGKSGPTVWPNRDMAYGINVTRGAIGPPMPGSAA